MRTFSLAILLGSSLGLVNLVVANDFSSPAFTDKSGDPVSHVEVHGHAHPEVRQAPAFSEPYRLKGVDMTGSVEVHNHAHRDVRQAPATSEPFQNKG